MLPEHYDLSLRVDPDRGDIAGAVGITFSSPAPVPSVSLDLVDGAIEHAWFETGGSRLPARIDVDDGRTTLVPAVPLTPGRWQAVCEYRACVRATPTGLYRTTHGGRSYLFTQNEPAFARTMVPCVDTPAAKATWRVTVTAPAGTRVLANAPPTGEALAANSTGFSVTPPMPSFLLGLAVGEFRLLAERADPVPIAIWSAGPTGDARWYLDAVARLLAAHAAYFDSAYPFAKLDVIVLPEHAESSAAQPGLLFLHDREVFAGPSATRAERLAILELASHELCHMWIGNLVTWASWRDVWLGEGVVTYRACAALAGSPDGRGIWTQVAERAHAALLLDRTGERDALDSGSDNPEVAIAAFDFVARQRATALIGAIEAAVGEERARAAYRGWIRDHAGGTTVGQDLCAYVGGDADRLVLDDAAGALLNRLGAPDGLRTVGSEYASVLADQADPTRLLDACAEFADGPDPTLIATIARIIDVVASALGDDEGAGLRAWLARRHVEAAMQALGDAPAREPLAAALDAVVLVARDQRTSDRVRELGRELLLDRRRYPGDLGRAVLRAAGRAGGEGLHRALERSMLYEADPHERAHLAGALGSGASAALVERALAGAREGRWPAAPPLDAALGGPLAGQAAEDVLAHPETWREVIGGAALRLALLAHAPGLAAAANDGTVERLIACPTLGFGNRDAERLTGLWRGARALAKRGATVRRWLEAST